MNTLFVTRHVPFELSKDSHGVFQRMRMMLQAAETASGAIQALFLASENQAGSPAKFKQVKVWLEAQLGPKIEVQVQKIEFRASRLTRLPFGLADYFAPSPIRTLTNQSIDKIRSHALAFKPDLIVAHRLEMFRAVRMATSSERIPTVLDLDDIEHLAFSRTVRSPPNYPTKPVRLAYVPLLMLEEVRALKVCRQVYVCSDVDNAKLKRWVPNSDVLTIPNGTAKPKLENKFLKDQHSLEVLFVGNLEYAPNSIGVNWFLQNIWPLVVAYVPEARLNIVGQGGTELKIPVRLKSSVVVHGYVESLTEMYQKATVAICPLLSGGGTRIKIIEAAAHKTPTVSTNIGAEGLAFEEGKSIKLTDQPEHFANTLIELLDDQSLSRALGEAAFSVFEQHYDRDMITNKISQSMGQAATIANCG